LIITIGIFSGLAVGMYAQIASYGAKGWWCC